MGWKSLSNNSITLLKAIFSVDSTTIQKFRHNIKFHLKKSKIFVED